MLNAYKLFLPIVTLAAALPLCAQDQASCNDPCGNYESGQGIAACASGFSYGSMIPGKKSEYPQIQSSLSQFIQALFIGDLQDNQAELFNTYMQQPSSLSAMKNIFHASFMQGFSCRRFLNQPTSTRSAFEHGLAVPGTKATREDINSWLKDIALIYFEGYLEVQDPESYAYYIQTPGDCAQEKSDFIHEFSKGYLFRANRIRTK